MILVIAKNDHKLRIEVGYGLEGAIPDVVAKRVIREVIAPHFLNGDFYGGIVDGTAALMKLIEGEQLPPPNQQAGGQVSGSDLESLLAPLLVASVLLGALLVGGLRAVFRCRRDRRHRGHCGLGSLGRPACGRARGNSRICRLADAGHERLRTWALGQRGLAGGGGGGWSGGGGFSGGGGGFGGGGASGGW